MAINIQVLTREEFNLALDPALPRGYLSAGAANKYGSCPMDYYFSYIEEKPFRRNEKMVLGSATHKLIQTCIEKKLELGNTPPIAEILDDSRKTTEDMYFNEEEEPESSDLGIEGVVDSAQKSFIVWYKNRMPLISPIASEKEVLFLLNDIPIKGYIDYIDATPTGKKVVDIKVSGKKRDPASSLQLATYALAERATLVGFDTILQPTKRLDYRLEISEATLSEAYLEHTARFMANVYRGVTQGFFPQCLPDHWLCNPKWCQNFSQCRGKK